MASLHIKQVIIRGFKTYKEQTSLSEDFHPGVNVVVGFNGSGKSNFFNAILFVISDHFGSMRPEVRKSLLHEGAGPAVLTAFVELAFDNTGRRMPIDRDEVRVRRTIGTKKDDYTLDGKHATKAEVFNLLESCGFTKSNPYYIVQQGKVAELTLMNDRRRLELIKEISGASVYDERRDESEKILEDVKTKREKTDEVVTVIAQRIKKLEEEQKELVEFQDLERTRKCLDWELTDRDWRQAQERLDALDFERRELQGRLCEIQRDAQQVKTAVDEAEAEVQQSEGKRARLEVERDTAEEARQHNVEQLTHARLSLSDEEKKAKESKQSREQTEAEISNLRGQVATAQKELDEQQPHLAVEQKERKELLQRKQICETQRDQLLAKQGRQTQYASVQQRDKALSQEILQRRERRERATAQLQECEKEVKRAEDVALASGRSAEGRRKDARRLEQDLQKDVTPTLANLNTQLEQCTEQRRRVVQERERLSREREDTERQVASCKAKLEGTMPRAQRTALSEVDKWVKKNNYQGICYGMLLEIIEVPKEYHIAAESTAGGSLFNFLVRDDDIAGKIVTLVRKNSLGSIVCMPLNQLQNRQQDYPRVQGMVPLVSVIGCPDWALPAVRQVFGRTVVCDSLELADEVSRKHNLDAITRDGDKVSSRGALTGGYQDPARFQRISLAARSREARSRWERLGPQLAAVDAQAQEQIVRLEALHSQRRDLQERRSKCRADLAGAAEAVQEQEAQQSRYEEQARRQRERRDELVRHTAECDAAIEALEAELKTKTLGELSVEEQARLQQLLTDIRELQKGLSESEDRCHGLERDLQAREQHLKEFLRRRLHDLESSLIRSAQADHDDQVQELTQAVARLERQQAEFVEELKGLRMQLADLDKELENKKADHAKLLQQDQQVQARMTQITNGLDDITMKSKQCIRKKNEADEKLRGLTVVSSDMNKYKKLEMGDLMKEHQKTTKALTKFEHVNKKAIDQFTTFTDQLKELEQKREELDASREALEGLMKQVDEQKEETLIQTLQQVDKHFQEIFSELVLGGVGALRMLGADDKVDDELEEDVGGATQTKGVRIEVSFTGQSSSFLTMGQLSGGQKTVVAIALVFAIQRLEPAPFYLFDEIDAALDTQYRTSVARLIARDAKNAQMVITTFRPEIIETADRFYRVYQKNRVSRIEPVPRQEAKRVIEEQTRLEKPDGE